MKMEFHGGKDLEQALKELKVTARKSVTRRVMKKALVPFIVLVRSLSAVRTGALAASYGITSKLAPRARQRARGVPASMVMMYAGTAASRGVWNEFGTAHSAPDHAGRDAWDQTKVEVFENLRDGMETEVKKATARARRKAERAAMKRS